MNVLKLSVLQLNNYIKSIIDAEEFLYSVSVFGEVTNFKISNGNAYFDIKEEGAQLSCLKFGADYDEIKNGDSVLVSGRLNYHPKFGKLSFIVNKIEPYGVGELYKKFIELKQNLETKGVFSEEHKKELPKFATNVGVVTSETGAVIHDIIEVARKKNPLTNIILFPVKVQGDAAEDEICKGIKYFDENKIVDVIIVARGGGSFEDLAPFNTEKVAMCVYNCNTPIVSGVGHETDFTLCDFAADKRAPTPSVASDICVFNYYEEVSKVKNLSGHIYLNLLNLVKYNEQNVVACVKDIVGETKNITNSEKHKFTISLNNLKQSFNNMLFNKRKALELLTLKLEKSNPLTLLKAGFSKTSLNGKVIKSVEDVQVNDIIETQLINGVILSKVTRIKGDK